MINKIKLISILLVTSQFLFSQEDSPFFKDYSWDENPNYSVDSINKNQAIIALKDKIVTEFYFIDGNLVEYFLEHRVLWLNSDDKIEDYNKVYLPYSSASSLEINRARVITKEGEIIELDASKILTAEDEETKQTYKYFAFEGIEKGSFIEYYYVVKRNPRYKGRKLSFQSTYIKKNVEFDLFSPSNLVFKFKSYNNLPSVIKDTLIENKQHWELHVKEIEQLDNETLSAYNASKKYMVYKLDLNTATNTADISSYGKVAQNIYTFYNAEYDKKTQTKINKFIDDAVTNKQGNQEDLIREVESFIKTNVYISENSSNELGDINNVLTQKVASESGIMKLYVSIFKTLKIKYEVVITSDRQNIKFDKDFEAQNFLTDFLFYFPKTKKYLAPIDEDSRYGFPPAFLTDNYGLFIKEVAIGDYKSGIGKIKFIKPIPAEKSYDKMIIDVDFDEDDITQNNIKVDRSINGYYSMYIHPFINLIKDDDRTELIESFAKSMNEDVDIIDEKIVNDDPKLFGIKPLQFILNIESDAFVEKAGKKYLFKLGELIGAQMQLYQEKERKLPVENEFQRSYYRTINVNIPNGYKIVNLEDINISNSYIKNGVELLSFNSFYELNDNALTITADEHYRINIIAVDLYEDYRKVINSAADFNKITLVLEPVE